MHIARPDTPRLPPIDPAADAVGPDLAAILQKTLVRDGEPLNIFRTLAHQPVLLKRFNALGGAFMAHGLLPAREREIVVLRVGWNCRSVYEFGQHTLMGRDAGLTDAEIASLATPRALGPWSTDDQALIALADELCGDDCVSEATFAALRGRWSDAELVELVMLAGCYR
ncbi:MAG TPA: carboxymuconolactone decarboxylase family protein, partial [Acidimicrobiia bacterium]|nr:carboxymuconolactone decarboxylase family protein [Acidimicrobiia bacterium]